ncbi:hypothetical protein DL96DRAFT_1597786 [Flagelloscypha sp. PMI_526]|nr:hypothetical protein DL96DRAFT_1597786 [Flagelloscypha sp. PMI_526]
MSRIFTALRNLVRPRGFVGRDLQGNTFFEYPNPNAPHKTKRSVEYVDPESYIGGKAQWYAWLTFTRNNPPTIEELQADIRRRQNLARNVALLEERDRQEQILMEQQRQTQTLVSEPKPDPEPPLNPQATETSNPWAQGSTGDFQPESWSPQSSIRRGS